MLRVSWVTCAGDDDVISLSDGDAEMPNRDEKADGGPEVQLATREKLRGPTANGTRIQVPLPLAVGCRPLSRLGLKSVCLALTGGGGNGRT